jgi:ATP-dependent DNA helicase DinG
MGEDQAEVATPATVTGLLRTRTGLGRRSPCQHGSASVPAAAPMARSASPNAHARRQWRRPGRHQHALLAIDALENIPCSGPRGCRHRRGTRAGRSGNTVSPPRAEPGTRRARRQTGRAFVDGKASDDLVDAAEALGTALAETPVGRVETLSVRLPTRSPWSATRRAAWSAFRWRLRAGRLPQAGAGARRAGPRRRRQDQRCLTVRRHMGCRAGPGTVGQGPTGRAADRCRVVARTSVQRPHVVLTSATLRLGGEFDAVARGVGLRPSERLENQPAEPQSR